VATRRRRARHGDPEAPRLPDHLEGGVVLDPDRSGTLADARVVAVEGDDLDDLELRRCVLEGVRLTARSARRLRLVDVVLRDCELSGLDLQEATLTRVRVERCRAEALEAGLVKAVDVAMVDTKLTEAGLRMTTWERLRLEGCDLRRAELLDARIDDAAVVGCDLTGVDLGRARLDGVTFRSSNLDDVVGATALAGATIDSPQLVPVALSVFAALGIRVDDGDGEAAG
jgi:uncharacterized protein YjbI with pentapeptide repeats